MLLITNYCRNVPWFINLTDFRGKGRNPSKNFIFFLGNLKPKKIASETNWPLLGLLFSPFITYQATYRNEQGGCELGVINAKYIIGLMANTRPS